MQIIGVDRLQIQCRPISSSEGHYTKQIVLIIYFHKILIKKAIRLSIHQSQ